MSQTLNESSPQVDGDFSYRQVPPTAPAAFVFGLVSLLALLTEFILPLTIIGVVIGALAVKRIRRSPNEYSGLWLAQSGLALCVVLVPSSIAVHAYTFLNEVPEGYQRLSFNQDIAKKGFIFDHGINRFHPDVDQLSDQKVFVKGYMLVKQQRQNIPEFVLCLDSGDCCFGGQPAVTDMIRIKAAADSEGFEYHPGMVFVAGTFKLLIPNPSGPHAAYQIDASHFGPAKTVY
ncbi:MAG: DUF4190 domain-containing protein [Planctomycetaceae bacterium]